ncbi:hypothetical protein KSP40_PGU001438 [Platanthera guangdongensis]|uniref:Uncharacterized protein n=1 Tax=Platanthera guangdongensis TaxID=2320717 RepID=A0ABR2LHW7_9ASPA
MVVGWRQALAGRTVSWEREVRCVESVVPVILFHLDGGVGDISHPRRHVFSSRLPLVGFKRRSFFRIFQKPVTGCCQPCTIISAFVFRKSGTAIQSYCPAITQYRRASKIPVASFDQYKYVGSCCVAIRTRGLGRVRVRLPHSPTPFRGARESASLYAPLATHSIVTLSECSFMITLAGCARASRLEASAGPTAPLACLPRLLDHAGLWSPLAPENL